MLYRGYGVSEGLQIVSEVFSLRVGVHCNLYEFMCVGGTKSNKWCVFVCVCCVGGC